MFKQQDDYWEQNQALLTESHAQQYAQQQTFKRTPGSANAAALAHHNATKYAHLLHRTPPENYVCYRCGQKGHFIQHCPTNGDPAFDKPKMRRTTGIPRSFLRTLENDEDAEKMRRDTPGGIMVTPDGGLVVAAPDARAWERFASRTKTPMNLLTAPIDIILADNETVDYIMQTQNVPQNLICSLCNRILRSAMDTPCCNNSYCEDCLTDYLGMRESQCPGCGNQPLNVDSLRVNVEKRRLVENIVRNAARKEEKKPEQRSGGWSSGGRRIATVQDNRESGAIGGFQRAAWGHGVGSTAFQQSLARLANH